MGKNKINRDIERIEQRINVKEKRYTPCIIISTMKPLTKSHQALKDWFIPYRKSLTCAEDNPDIYIDTRRNPKKMPHVFLVSDEGIDDMSWKRVRKYQKDFLEKHSEEDNHKET